MTDACNTTQSASLPAARKPCKECPALISNADKPAPGDWYTDGNFDRIWAAVARENNSLPCHLFDDADNTRYDNRSAELGLQKPTDIGGRKECAGVAAMIHRELRIAATYPDWESYAKARPAALQRTSYETALARLSGDGLPLTAPADPMNPALIDPSKRVNTDSLAWKLGDSGAASLLSVVQSIADDLKLPLPACDCPVCANHSSVHKPAEVQLSTGETVQADFELVPLLRALAEAGIRTTASCEDLNDAMEQLWPEQIPILLAQENPRTINYAAPLRRNEAVVRFENRAEPARVFIRAIRFMDGIHLSDGGTQAQITFPLRLLPQILKIARKTQ